MSALHPLIVGFGTTFKPKSRLLLSRWADLYRKLPQSGSAEHGQWSTDRVPYLREIQDALSESSRAEEIAVIKGTQLAFTEMGINWAMYKADIAPGPMLTILPTELVATRLSKQRIGPSLELCDRLRDKFSDKSRDGGNTLLQKDYPGGSWILGGANSPSALSSMPIGDLHIDEVDRCPIEVGDEGDTLDIVIQRISNFPRSKVLYTSSPSRSKQLSRIHNLYQKSDQRIYEVPCPYCNGMQMIEMANLKWNKGDPDDVRLFCLKCGVGIEEYWKTKMLAAGAWRARNPGHWRWGFFISSLYSPLGWLSWVKVARRFEAAEGDPAKTKTFVNTILGECYEESGVSLSGEYLEQRAEDYPLDGQEKLLVPDGVLVLVLAVDVQKDRLEYEIIGWGVNEESWGIEYGVLRGDPAVLKSGDPSNPSVWAMLDQVRRRVFTRADGSTMRIACTTVDMGGSHPDQVQTYCRERESVRVYAVRGSSRHERAFISKGSRSNFNSCLFFNLGVGEGKTIVLGRLKLEATEGPGVCHYPSGGRGGYDATYYAGLISEKLVERELHGKTVERWEKVSRSARNEPLDLRVYGTAAVRLLRPDWEALAANRAKAKEPRQPVAPKRRDPVRVPSLDDQLRGVDAMLKKMGIS